MTRHNYRLLIEYEGSSFFGWQTQKFVEPTLQNTINNALRRLFGEEICVIASGRTDSGVHSLGQIAHFKSQKWVQPEKIKKALNGLLKPNIVILEATEVPLSFHAQKAVTHKVYSYLIWNSELPSAFWRRFSWWVAKPIEWQKIETCLKTIIGTHDFKSFQSAGTPVSSTQRTLFRTGIEHNQESQVDSFMPFTAPKNLYTIYFEGEGFLKQMVRNLVGTLVLVGLGKISVEDFQTILKTKDRKKAGPTAPPQGLFLLRAQEGEAPDLRKSKF